MAPSYAWRRRGQQGRGGWRNRAPRSPVSVPARRLSNRVSEGERNGGELDVDQHRVTFADIEDNCNDQQDSVDCTGDAMHTNRINNSQTFPLFYSSQPTQLLQSFPPPEHPTPTPPPSSLPTKPIIPAKPPIRLINQPPTLLTTTKRPTKAYRGSDPVKKLVTNKKLQAIFLGKALPKERVKAAGERMELRMGMGKATK